jgi:hypothetical protein
MAPSPVVRHNRGDAARGCPYRRFLVTAGNTRERIDRVRDWGNVFTGNTGFAIARALAATARRGDLLTSNRAHLADIASGGRRNLPSPRPSVSLVTPTSNAPSASTSAAPATTRCS